MFLISQKKRSDALNATQKTITFSIVWFLKKSRKTSKNNHFKPVLAKDGNLMRFSWFFQKPFFVKSGDPSDLAGV